MEIKLKKWGNSIGLRIPYTVAQNLGIDENSTLKLSESENSLILTKKQEIELDDLIDSIPDGFSYPEDVADFVSSEPQGKELV